MANLKQLKDLGELIRARRKEMKLTLKEVEERSGVGLEYLSNIERGYVNPSRGPVTPGDEILFSVSEALSIPLRELHAALGRVPAGSPAEQLAREHLAPYTAETQISREQVESLAQELDDIARVRAERITGQYQSQSQTGGGKQAQKQKQVVS